MSEKYEIYERDGHWWFRCKECGHGAGYATKDLCALIAYAHVNLPHQR